MSPTREPIHIAFLGCGFITRVHSRHIRRLGGLIVPGVCQPRPGEGGGVPGRSTADRAATPDYAAAIEDPRDPRGRRRRAAAVSPATWRCRRSPPGSTCSSRSRRFPAWTTTRRCATHATVPGVSCSSARTTTTSRWPCACARQLAAGAIGEMVFAHFTTLARRLKTADDWRNDETMAGGDAFFEEGIHWLHLAGSLGPTITSVTGLPAGGVARRSRSPREEHAGGVPVRQRRRRRALLLARGAVAAERPAALEAVRPRAASSPSSRTARSCWCAGAGLPRLLLPGIRDARGYQAMYRDFARAIRLGRRARDEPRAGDGRPRPHGPGVRDGLIGPGFRCGRHTTTSSSSAPARAAARWRTRSRTPARASCSSSAATSCRRKRRTGARTRSGSSLRYRTTERWLDERGREFQPYTHYCVGGNTKFWGSVLYRLRREDFDAIEHVDGVSPGVADRLRHARAVLRRAPSACITCTGSTASIPPRRRAGRTRLRPSRTPTGWRRSCRVLRRRGLHPSPLAARPDPPGRARRMRAVQHVQLVPLQAPREERSRRVLRASRVAAAERRAVDERAGPPADHRRHRRRGSRRSRSSATARPSASPRRCSSSRAAP